ncbi:thyroid receptor-interacting protein 11 [Plakobranchus ocellatus]|uniref:Thyroid receptor-interacting protein 11 n=1 Tax=Plakobranchus ocellatus TaxID=259542 RepID=A0AAV4CUL0_9GAST|nr:thyroid receptor-interacting protein 11 [Plakobranchus ocellatus]
MKFSNVNKFIFVFLSVSAYFSPFLPPSDPATELRLAREKLQQLDALLSAQRQENERLKRVNRELEEKAEGSELQINTISREYRSVLEGKEKQVNTLKHQNQELLEHQARAASFTPASPSSQAFSGRDNDGWDSLSKFTFFCLNFHVEQFCCHHYPESL